MLPLYWEMSRGHRDSGRCGDLCEATTWRMPCILVLKPVEDGVLKAYVVVVVVVHHLICSAFIHYRVYRLLYIDS